MADSHDFPLKNAVQRPERITKDFQVTHESIHSSHSNHSNSIRLFVVLKYSSTIIRFYVYGEISNDRVRRHSFNFRSRILKFLIINFV